MQIAPTLKPERFVDDAEELVAWLRKDLGKTRIFVLGTSWGSYVGLELARRRPEWLHAYIGVGQATNTPESERRGYAFALAAARKAGNMQALAELEFGDVTRATTLADRTLAAMGSRLAGRRNEFKRRDMAWSKGRVKKMLHDPGRRVPLTFVKTLLGNPPQQRCLTAA